MDTEEMMQNKAKELGKHETMTVNSDGKTIFCVALVWLMKMNSVTRFVTPIPYLQTFLVQNLTRTIWKMQFRKFVTKSLQDLKN